MQEIAKSRIDKSSKHQAILLTFCYFDFERRTARNRTENGGKVDLAGGVDRLRRRRWQSPQAAFYISACGVWHFRVRHRPSKYVKKATFSLEFGPFHRQRRTSQNINISTSARYKNRQNSGESVPRYRPSISMAFSAIGKKPESKQITHFC